MIIKLDRKTYRNIKSFNREQMEKYINQIYLSGFNEGFDVAGKPVAIPFNAQELTKILYDELNIRDIELVSKIIQSLTTKYKTLLETVTENQQAANKE